MYVLTALMDVIVADAMLTGVYSSCIEVKTSLYMVETRRASSPRT
jgi:hypothetical protein